MNQGDWEQACSQAWDRLVEQQEQEAQYFAEMRLALLQLGRRPDADQCDELCDREFNHTLDCAVFGPLMEILRPEGEDDGTRDQQDDD